MLKAAAIFIALASFFASPAFAGTTGIVSGVVTDTNDEPKANTEVTIASPSEIHHVKTDAHGFYVVLSVAPDVYRVSFEHAGWNPRSYAGVVVASDNVTRVNTRLNRWLGGPVVRQRIVIRWLVSERTWDSYIIPPFLRDHQIP